MRRLVLIAGLVLGVVLVALPAAAQGRGAARLADGDESSEYWDLTAVFDSGHRLFVRFSISNEGPGDRTAYAVGQVVFPDGRIMPFKNGRLEGDWRITEDRLRMKIGSNVLDLRQAMNHFEVDKNKLGIKVFCDFQPRHAPLRWAAAPRGLNVELLAVGTPVDGTIWIREWMADQEPTPVSGRVSLTHVWMDEGEMELAAYRIEPHLLGPGESGVHAYLLQVKPTKGAARSWLVARRADGTWVETDAVEIGAVGSAPKSPKGYPLPAALEIGGPGLSGRVELGPEILKHDPLELAPRPFRWLLAFRADPLHVWLSSRARLEWQVDEREKLAFEGVGVTSFYFMKPVE